MEIIPNWHPFVVHFSVALLVTATILLAWATIKGRLEAGDRLVVNGRFILWFGLVAIVITVAAGLQAYYSVDHDAPSHAAMTTHRNWAFVTLVAFLIVGAFMWRKRGGSLSVLSVGALVVSTGLLLSTAYKGGELVYKYGLGVQSLPSVSGDGHDHDHAEAAPKATIVAEAPVGDGHAHPAAVIADPASVADGLRDALKSGDVDAVSKLLAEDVKILEGGHAQISREDYMGGHMISDMAFLTGITSTIEDRKVSRSGDLAWVITHSRMQGSYKDKPIDIASREMLVMKHDGHTWQITLIHWGEK